MLLKFAFTLSIVVCLLVSIMMCVPMIWGKAHSGDILTVILLARLSDRYHYQLLDVRTRKTLVEPISVPQIQGVLLHPNGQDIVVFSGTQLDRIRFYFYNVKSGKLIYHEREFDVTSTSFDFSDEDQSLTVWSRLDSPSARTYYTIDIQTGAEQQSSQRPLDAALLTQPAEIGEIRSIFPSPDGQWVAFTTASKDTYTLNLETGERFQLNDFHTAAEITALDWSPDSRFLVFSAAVTTVVVDHPVYISDPTGKHLELFDIAGTNPTWSPDGRYVAVQAWDNLYRWAGRSFSIVPVSSKGEWLNSKHILVENALGPQWSQPGNYLTVVRQDGSRYHLVMIRPENGEAQTLLTGTSDYPVNAFRYWR